MFADWKRRGDIEDYWRSVLEKFYMRPGFRLCLFYRLPARPGLPPASPDSPLTHGK